MMTIKFQNPTKGPLITVTFDDAEEGVAAKGFAPAPMPPATVLPGAKALIDLGNAAGAGGGWISLGPLVAYAAALSCAGDSGPRVAPIDRPPLGIGVEEWGHTLNEKSRVDAVITVLQHQIRLYELWGLGWLANSLRDQLDEVFAKDLVAAVQPDMKGHRVQTMASADASAPPTKAQDAAKPDAPDSEIPPPDWEALAAEKNPKKVAQAVGAYIARAQDAVAARVDQDQHYVAMASWYEAEILPVAHRLDQLLSDHQKEGVILLLQGLKDRLALLTVQIPMYLKSAQPETARVLSMRSPASLAVIIDEIQTRYADRVDLYTDGIEGVRLSPAMDVEKFKLILEDLVRNAAAEPQRKGMAVPILIEMVQGVLVVASADKQDELSPTWDVIQKKANEVSILVDVWVEDGVQTTANVIPENGFFEPDLLRYVLTGEGDGTLAKILIAEMTLERRLAVLREMDNVYRRIEYQALSQGIEFWALQTPPSLVYVQELRASALRFEKVVEMLIYDLPPHHGIAFGARDMVARLKTMANHPEGLY